MKLIIHSEHFKELLANDMVTFIRKEVTSQHKLVLIENMFTDFQPVIRNTQINLIIDDDKIEYK